MFRWQRAYRYQGLAGLVDGRWEGAGSSGGGSGGRGEDDPFLVQIKGLWLDLKRKPLKVCHEIACYTADQHGWPKCSYEAARRYVKRIPEPVVLKLRFGKDDAADTYVERDYNSIASNDIWCGDHHQFDVVVLDESGEPCRPWLTGWEDLRSRLFPGWEIRTAAPCTDPILSAFHAGAKAYGVPRNVYVDNGKDYDSWALHGRTKQEKTRIHVEHDGERLKGAFALLGVGKLQAHPYNARAKPIERAFRTVCDRFSRLWPSYCGNKPENRPEGLAALIKAGKLPGIAEFRQKFAQWLESDYHLAAHHGQGMDGRSPAQVWQEHLGAMRTAPEGALDALCLKPTRPVKVGRIGVVYEGMSYGADCGELFPLVGKEVALRVDDQDRSKVQVWSVEGKFICIARQNAKVPFAVNGQEIRQALKQRAKLRKLRREYHERHEDMNANVVDLAIAAAAKRNKANRPQGADPGGGSPVLRPVRTAIDDQFPALQRAMEREQLRPAVGAETVPSLTDVGAMLNSQGRPMPATDAPAGDVFFRLTERLRGES